MVIFVLLYGIRFSRRGEYPCTISLSHDGQIRHFAWGYFFKTTFTTYVYTVDLVVPVPKEVPRIRSNKQALALTTRRIHVVSYLRIKKRFRYSMPSFARYENLAL